MIKALAISLVLLASMGRDSSGVFSGLYPTLSASQTQASAPRAEYHIPPTDQGEVAGVQFYRFRDDKWNASIICFFAKNAAGNITTNLSCVKE